MRLNKEDKDALKTVLMIFLITVLALGLVTFMLAWLFPHIDYWQKLVEQSLGI